MAKVARIGDRVQGGFCYYAWRWHHTTYYCGWWYPGTVGTIIQGSPDVKANGIGMARYGDMVQHDYNPSAPYPHDDKGYILTCSSTVEANGKGVARIGDTCGPMGGSGLFYYATIYQGSPDVEAA